MAQRLDEALGAEARGCAAVDLAHGGDEAVGGSVDVQGEDAAGVVELGRDLRPAVGGARCALPDPQSRRNVLCARYHVRVREVDEGDGPTGVVGVQQRSLLRGDSLERLIIPVGILDRHERDVFAAVVRVDETECGSVRIDFRRV
jgi:hypothetical protein